jgi:hypothetical protein
MKIEHTIGLLIDNIDNPGWKLMYNYNNRDWDALKDSRQCDFYHNNDISLINPNWMLCLANNIQFTASGGPLYLGVLLKTFEQWHNKQPIDPVELPVTSNLKDPKEMDNLEWLQWYYFDVCNGDWEHTYGVKIEAVKEGWTLSIDIADTTFEDFEYEGVDTEHYRCWLEKRVFKGTGGRGALDEMIGEFRRWMSI